MSKFALIKAGVVVNVTIGQPDATNYDACIDITGLPAQIGWQFDGQEFTPPVVVATDYGTRITRLAFRLRIRDALPAIYHAAKTEVVAQIAIDDLAAAQYVDLADPITAANLNGLVAAGLMTESVRDKALNDPVQASEVV